MAKTVYYLASSLDGYIATSDDSLDWLTKYEPYPFEGAGAEPMEGSYDRFYDGIGALVMGSATYEWVLGEVDEWPYSGRPTWVLSTRELPPPPDGNGDVRVTAAPARELHAELSEAAGDRAIWVVGGGGVASQFAGEGLLDELIVTVVPVVLGEGKPLFERPLPGGPMQLTGTRAFDTGMVELRYRIVR